MIEYKRYRLSFMFLLSCLLMAFISCNRNQDHGTKSGVLISDSLKHYDSISTLDSLANVNKVRNNLLAIRYAKEAVRYSKKIKDPASYVKSLKMLGLVYLYSAKDSSYVIYNNALRYARENQVSGEIPQLLYNLADISNTAFNYQTAISQLDTCIILARKEKMHEVLANAYNLMGNIYNSTGDNKASLVMYDSSYKIASKHYLTRQMGVALGNMAKFDPSQDSLIRKLKKGISFLQKTGGNEEEIASFYNNIAVHLSDPDSVLAYSAKALSYCKDINLPIIRMSAYNNMAYAFLDKRDIIKAEKYLKDYAIPIAVKEKNLDWLSNLYDSYADIFIAQKDFNQAFLYERKAYQTRLLAFNQTASEQVRLLAAMLDLKNKDLAIREARENLKVKQADIRNMWFGIFLLILIILAVLLIFFLFLQRNKLTYQKSLTQSARRIIQLEENDKARVAMELHDLVGPMIFAIKRQMDDLDIPDEKVKALLLDRLQILTNHLRSLSHRMNKTLREKHSFSELIIGLFEDMKALSSIPLHLKMPSGEPPLLKEQFDHFYRILQELLTNGIKYVNEGVIEVTISWDRDGLFLFYRDTGPGFDSEKKDHSGMGMMNISERAGFLGGKALLKSKPGEGTKWTIHIPVKIKK